TLPVAEAQLQAGAGAEDRPAVGDAPAYRIREPPLLEAAGRRAGVPNAGDHRQSCGDDLSGVGRDRRARSRPCEGGADAAQVAGTVVGEDYVHSDPLVEGVAAPFSEHASRSARPIALNAASAT